MTDSDYTITVPPRESHEIRTYTLYSLPCSFSMYIPSVIHPPKRRAMIMTTKFQRANDSREETVPTSTTRAAPRTRPSLLIQPLVVQPNTRLGPLRRRRDIPCRVELADTQRRAAAGCIAQSAALAARRRPEWRARERLPQRAIQCSTSSSSPAAQRRIPRLGADAAGRGARGARARPGEPRRRHVLLFFARRCGPRHRRQAEQLALRRRQRHVLAGVGLAEEWKRGEADVGGEDEADDGDGVVGQGLQRGGQTGKAG